MSRYDNLIGSASAQLENDLGLELAALDVLTRG